MRLSIIIPVHNEGGNIDNLISRIENELRLDFEIIVVNDHSTDNTVKIAEELAVKYKNIRLIDNNFEPGFANTIKTGLANLKTEVVVPVMGDFCDGLSTIPIMLEKIEEGYDVVCASRYIRGGARLGGSKIKGFFSRFVGWSIFYFLKIPMHDVVNSFKMYRKKVIDSVDIMTESFEVSMELALKAYYGAFKITEVPTVWKEREKGKTNFKMLKLFPYYLKLYLWAVFKGVRS